MWGRDPEPRAQDACKGRPRDWTQARLSSTHRPSRQFVSKSSPRAAASTPRPGPVEKGVET